MSVSEPQPGTFTATYLANSGNVRDDSTVHNLRATSRSELLRKARATCPPQSRLTQIVAQPKNRTIWTKETGKLEFWEEALAKQLFNE